LRIGIQILAIFLKNLKRNKKVRKLPINSILNSSIFFFGTVKKRSKVSKIEKKSTFLFCLIIPQISLTFIREKSRERRKAERK
jgi:hypothetical protein